MRNVSSKTVVAVQEDLFFTVKIADAAKRVGLETVFVQTGTAALARLAERPVVVVVDLNLKSMDPVELVSHMKSGEFSDVPVVGYVPHVQVELKQRALAAGCNAVFARSTFSTSLSEILSRYASQTR